MIRTSLSLHRGTAHGASTLGVLDDEGIEVAAISGTSVGELNRNALVSGMESTCRDGAREYPKGFIFESAPKYDWSLISTLYQ